MRNHTIRYVLFNAVSGAVLALACAANAISGDIHVSVHTVEDAPFLANIPLLLAVDVKNVGLAAVTIPEPTLASRDNPYNSLDILVARSGNDSFVRVSHVVPEFRPWKAGINPKPPAAMILQAGEVRQVVVVLSYDWVPENIEAIVVPGVLQVRAALCDYGPDAAGNPGIDRNNFVTGNTLAVPIGAPKGAGAAALDALRAMERPWLLAHPAAVEHVTQDGDFRRFQDIANMDAGEYSRHAAAVVAYMYAQGNGLDLHPGRPPQPKVAQKWLDRAMAGKSETGIYPEWRALAERLAETEEQP